VIKTSTHGLYVVAAAIIIVGVAVFDVSLGSLALFALFLACPLMMIFMMRGMHGQDTRQHGSQTRSDDLPKR
jgi:multisubunit Na+/H+ antiporter MnhG subunit